MLQFEEMGGLQIDNVYSIDDLKKMADIQDDVTMSLKKRDCNNNFKSVLNIIGQAEAAMRNKDKLTAYVLYLRAGTICSLIHKNSRRNEFVKTIEGRKYIEIFKTTLENIELLSRELKTYFEDRELASKLSKEVNIIEDVPTPVVLAPVANDSFDVFNELITAKQLMDFAKKGNRVLIIDYRQNTDIQINFKDNADGSNIVVALCPPQFVESNITLVQLSKVIPIKERQKVDHKEMEKYDLIIFMDNDDPKKDSNGEYLPPANYLFKGLTIYAYNSRLKRRPVFLKGGFKMWSFTYPTYTDQEFHGSLFSEDDEFGRLLRETKKDFNIHYHNYDQPRLLEPPWPASNGDVSQQQPIYNNEVKFRQVPTTLTNYGPPSESTHIPQPIPNIPAQHTYPDASNTMLSSRRPPETTFPPTNDTPGILRSTTPSIPDRKLKPSTMPRTILPPPTQPILKSVPKNLPAVGTLGGARIAGPPQIPSKQSQYANGYPRNDQAGYQPRTTTASSTTSGSAGTTTTLSPSQSYAVAPPRPPTPDRSTKVSAISQGDTEKLLKLYSVAYAQLERTAQHGRQPGVGFRNMGNTCFMNTTLQAIINTPKIRDIFNREEFIKYVNTKNSFGTRGTISSVFAALVDLYFSGKVSAITPDIFLTTFATEVNSQLADRRQHDAQEFQIYLMDALHEDTNRVQTRKPFEQNYDGRDMGGHARDYDGKLSKFASSPVADLFNLRTVSVVTCSICQTSSATFEDQAQISLELEDNTFVRLEDCLRRHFKQEILQNDSRWNCPKCKRPQVSTRKTNIWRMPRTLVIHFKRFSQYGSSYVKNDTNVHFDIEALRLDHYLHPEAPQQRSMFSLYAVTNHSGTLNSGHYTSYVRSQHRWLKFDDDFVSEVSREALQSNKAFVLFYTTSG